MTAADLTDRDVIDTTTAQGHLDWVRSIIAHRAPEIDPGDIADAYGTPTEPDPGDDAAEAWSVVMENILDALIEVETRLDNLERTITGGRDDADERGRGQA